MVEQVPIAIRHHAYSSRFVITDVRHDIILGMPWNADVKPTVDYERSSVEIDDVVLPSRNPLILARMTSK